ncbi:MAG: anhydro-N-acetylmuramic acid kinase [Candidatus Zixiibacteriota bacterium]
MKLDRLLRKQELTILGINSGTSADGIDLAVVRCRTGKPVRFVDGTTIPYNPRLRSLILETADSPTTSLEHLIRLDNLLGVTYGNAAAKFIRRLNRRRITVDAVASHGQTVRHVPTPVKLAGIAVHGTMQLGSLDQIAARTGKIVVGDFRQADIALGNEGAPITVAAVARIFGSPKESRLVLNIGGMANYFFLPRNSSKIIAEDTGPGNVLSDLLAHRLFGRRYDRNGALAAQGTVSSQLLKTIRTASHRTRSTGRELYGAALADQLMVQGRKLRLSHHDLLATAVELTVDSIAARIAPILRKDRSIRKLYLTGGGIHNSFLRQRLHDRLSLPVTTVTELGMDPDLVEAASFAVMGAACLHGESMRTRFKGADSQRVKPISGRIVQPPDRP